MQLTLDDCDSPAADPDLREVTFVVVDLETTGGSPKGGDAITEIGAVKVRGGEVLGEFATLVDPERGIAPHITHLTGITTAMVTGAPTIASVLPAFLEFAQGAVLVAHNARFDIGFLKAAAAATGTPWPKPQTLCTVQLARRVLTRDEAPSVKLSEMARLFRAETTPTHRALDDARATVDVLHGLIGRVGNLGIRTFAELRGHLPSVTPQQRAKRGLADPLPERPGVYLFRGPGDEVLYVGTSRNLRRRVRSYFTSGETRGRIKEMVGLAERVDHVECAHALEAAARELRLIAAHTPPYNRRSKYPKRGWWICLTVEPFPRLAVKRSAPAGSVCLGPIRSRTEAADLADLIAETCGLRTCTTRLRPGGAHACALGPDGTRPVGGCHGSVSAPEPASLYRPRADRAAAMLTGRSSAVFDALQARLDSLVEREFFESAARLRDRTAQLVDITLRSHSLAAFAEVPELSIAHPDGAGGWELSIVRHGRLAAAGVAPRGVPPMPVFDRLRSGAETVYEADAPADQPALFVPDALFPADVLHGASPEEAALLRRWALQPGTRIVEVRGTWGEPLHGAGRWREWAERALTAGRDARAAASQPQRSGRQYSEGTTHAA
ncbi:DNA polymerase III, epsilon subunit OS=Tsukamurella paurometabola (strain ATCC 8368 / DSM /CCUG 35730 / CIP 100753 / JCM 10117 / KCTC 9821 / NBRC 16120/ NCIMB 702349 / NCTC 13040) OX=521096 GN=Tpau_2686 PE=4 SV=1 [Tsukamurella paurometabola]|uniref:DNA polymerase III, epsilon subunit n=1 Tax=Tsukamurella paurometabola (strain ATCC 8368 / DSM 20162 / CCUG 35730 / CIP 100753 / JCM 10117 / KCTC 9821 / NBRC 16120 / NCIMB 702349 / NCTC 13040) TaxID=521096 RepID=D5USL5_TSUPD|nr:DEDD exonuclease domain-containing protein [Tsukamurella paurometabola]ADG79286.1 DNA polymerase III, epsilon subunit [Tsukamurella paurometabola DSM 20162]SUP34919.1 DNA polymerase III polC-type [Tsukamurella paurometabola]